MKGNFNLTIDKDVTEQLLVENCLAYYHSGYEFMPILCLYALAKGWHYKKLIYYHNLIKGGENVRRIYQC